ncbi:hypothetical protein B0E45_17810 [Sinorhizobium sp. A49]|uniref:GmrSD restriction endonuclease domain-containing protein n=1 Tax=Sinorhizobium sp. A49 TaxID=1945861 RepID=UPI0009879E6E|nr:DUF262 domain-containing protein [Sinorhizobium sp. A49]OOG68184.1 hypothetical protein B0E45_17810 [Sinorhizobium sp. A49]
MTSSARSFRDLVQDAHDGKLKLPAFQRKWRWKNDKVIKLFDSLRQQYPIGALLFLKGENELLAPRTFEGANNGASGKPADFLVLDGQQRLTAGIHLFHATGTKQYYLRLDRLKELVNDKKIDLTDKKSTEEFVHDLDETDSYLIARNKIADPRSLLIKNHLLCTAILADGTDLPLALQDYVKAFPDSADLCYRLIMPHFGLAKTDTVPVIEIDASTQIEAISRIFTTLNTTGQLLTPFELVVSILFPQNIDLSQEIDDFREKGTYYPNMDKTGEILLQTIAMLGGKEPKKANLPKTIDASLYLTHKKAAYDALENLGQFLTGKLGAGLNIANVDMVPYDAIYAPMALALATISTRGLKGPEQIVAEKKLSRWYVGAAIAQRYQEGVHNKQTRDLAEFVAWLDDDLKQPAWLSEVTIPRLLRHSPSGAIGKLIRSQFNLKSPKDVCSRNIIGFSPGAYPTEKHHVFPVKYLPTLPDWQKGDQGDVILNLMFLEADTNKRWINGNPFDHLSEAIKYSGDVQVQSLYAQQFIEDTALSVLKKPSKTKKDFEEFLVLREKTIQNYLSSSFDFPIGGAEPFEEDMSIE